MKLQRAIGATYENECVMPEFEYDALVDEIANLRAELATIKPDWTSAPEWASELIGSSYWTGKADNGITWAVEDAAHFTDFRPTEDK